MAIETKKKEGVKRPLVVTEEARKKVMVKKPLVTSKPKLPLPIKKAILVKPTTLVDSNGEIMGINEY